MTSQTKHSGSCANVCKTLSVCLLMFCLAFLTSLNYFIYPSDAISVAVVDNLPGSDDSESDYPPSGPTEEKANSGASGISEEILHELHPEFNFKALDQLYLHHITEAANIEMFHPELVLPPPKA